MEVSKTEMAPGLIVLPVYLVFRERKLLKVIVGGQLVVHGAGSGETLLLI